MRQAGLVVLGVSVTLAGLLFVLWLVGFLFAVAGGLIHLLLVLGVLLGLTGGLIGIVLIVVGKSAR